MTLRLPTMVKVNALDMHSDSSVRLFVSRGGGKGALEIKSETACKASVCY